MSETLGFVCDRALASRSAQKTILPKWEWPGKTLAQWDTQNAGLETQKAVVADAKANVDVEREELDDSLDVLHKRTLQWLTFLRLVYRNHPAKTRALAFLTARAQSRRLILEEAQELESMWRKLDPTWVPLPGQTLALFQADRELCLTKMEIYADAKSTWRIESEELNQQQEDLSADCRAWYEATENLSLPEQALVVLHESSGLRLGCSEAGKPSGNAV
jgi:hypothetical protein